MPSHPPYEESTQIRVLIENFIRDRLEAKLEKLKPEEVDKRQELHATYEPQAWLTDAARRVSQIQLASHTLKAIHPGARGTNIQADQDGLHSPGILSTASVGETRDADVVGNAAALDVFKFLTLQHEGRSLLQRLTANEPAATAALSENPELAEQLRSAFVSIAAAPLHPASHTLARQVFFPVSSSAYHLLAPLFPTTLVHRLQSIVREHRFGDAAKAARDARREGNGWSEGYCEYPDLAIRKLGGTKPQNISQLNSERYGENWLLASLPPFWQSLDVRAPLNADSIFDRWFGRRKSVRTAVTRLREFLESAEHNNVGVRQERARLTADICDEVLYYATSLRSLDAGWSADPACTLHEAEKLWLDPLRAQLDDEFRQRRSLIDWRNQVSRRFANWLNVALESDQLKLDQFTATQWENDLEAELNMFREVLQHDE